MSALRGDRPQQTRVERRWHCLCCSSSSSTRGADTHARRATNTAAAKRRARWKQKEGSPARTSARQTKSRKEVCLMERQSVPVEVVEEGHSFQRRLQSYSAFACVTGRAGVPAAAAATAAASTVGRAETADRLLRRAPAAARLAEGEGRKGINTRQKRKAQSTVLMETGETSSAL